MREVSTSFSWYYLRAREVSTSFSWYYLRTRDQQIAYKMVFRKKNAIFVINNVPFRLLEPKRKRVWIKIFPSIYFLVTIFGSLPVFACI